jgi:hypothetical protein
VAKKPKQPKQEIPPLFPPGYWDRPEPRAKGDATVQPIQIAVGQALSVWEYLEDELSYLCILFADIQENGKGSRAVYRLFGSIESSIGRRKALEALAEIYFWPHFKDDIKSRFKQLMEAVSDASGRRADIAHGMVVDHHFESREGEAIGAFLLPAGYNTKRNKPFRDDLEDIEAHIYLENYPFNTMLGHYRYTSEDIKGFTLKFRELHGKIAEYMQIAIRTKAALTVPSSLI